MRYLSAAQMREADRRCIEELGIPGAVLMHHAGEAVLREVKAGPVGVVCGKGNNGGDGFVVAYLARLRGLASRVVLLARPEEIQGDAATYLKVYRSLGGDIEIATEPDDATRQVQSLGDCTVLVDAMLGTGARGAVREPYRSAILAWPAVETIAVDLPSGLDADRGEAGEACIRADVTVTMQFPKLGFQNPKALPYVGRLVIADIGIPEICADDDAWSRR